MASKRYSLLTGVLCLLASYGFSQTSTTQSGYNAADSSVVPSRRMPQHTEFMNGTYNFPAKPRNQWELGLKVGSTNIAGDVSSIFPGFGAGVHLRKAFGYVFSARLSYMYGVARGLNWKPSSNYSQNEAWGGYTGQPVYYNYRTELNDLALEGIFSLNNVRFHKSKTGVNLYALAGVGLTTYQARVNKHNGETGFYNFASIAGGSYKNRKDTRDALKDLLDDSYETAAETDGEQRAKVLGMTAIPVGHVGAGIAFKLNNRLNIALEDRFTFTKSDLLDGQRWAEQVAGNPVLTGNFDSYNFLSLGLNINIGGKSVEPLWWTNPLDYAYSEIRNPRLMRLPKPVLPDSDGDGVPDQFDLEQTPAGVPVDVRGVSRDTDGDGVPDFRDKELITPTYCQPVDADGVGKCPCPEGCATAPATDDCAAALGALPSVTFTGNSVRLSNDAQSLLASVAARLRNNPSCRVVVVGYCASNKAAQQRSWDRVNAVINHLVEREGISQDRFIFQHAQEGGDCNTVDIRAAAAGEEGPSNVPAPHPNLRRN